MISPLAALSPVNNARQIEAQPLAFSKAFSIRHPIECAEMDAAVPNRSNIGSAAELLDLDVHFQDGACMSLIPIAA
jgi:hypothetical protein